MPNGHDHSPGGSPRRKPEAQPQHHTTSMGNGNSSGEQGKPAPRGRERSRDHGNPCETPRGPDLHTGHHSPPSGRSSGNADRLQPPPRQHNPGPQAPGATLGPFQPLRRLRRIQGTEEHLHPLRSSDPKEGAGRDSWRKPGDQESRAQAEGSAPRGSHSRGLTTTQNRPTPAEGRVTEVESTPPGELYKGRAMALLPDRSNQPLNGVPSSSLPSGQHHPITQSERSGRAQRNTDLTQPRSGAVSHTDNNETRHHTPRSGRHKAPSFVQTSTSAPLGGAERMEAAPRSGNPNETGAYRDTPGPPMIADFGCPQGLRPRLAQHCTGYSNPSVPITVRTATPMGSPQGPPNNRESRASDSVNRTRRPTRR